MTGYGTGGTLKGVARVLAKEMPDTKIIVCEPEDAPLLGSGTEQARNPDGSPAAAHPAFKPHPMQGWTPGFHPEDHRRRGGHEASSTSSSRSPGAEAIRMSKELATKEGIFVGITVGRDLRRRAAHCRRGARRAPPSSPCCPTPASATSRTPLFADIPADMTPEEVAISKSTPAAQMG